MGYSGTTTECLVEYGKQRPEVESRQLLADFAQVSAHPTVRSWLSGKTLPMGESLLRARCFLYLAGFKVEEFEFLPSIARRFALLLAFDLISLDEAQEELGYKGRSSLFHVALRGMSPQQDKVFRIERLVTRNSNDLDRLIEQWRERINGPVSSDTVPEAPEARVAMATQAAASPVRELPAEPVPVSASPSSVPKRKRTRARTVQRRIARSEAMLPANVRTANVLMHMVQTMEEIIGGTDEQARAQLAVMLQSRVSVNRMDALISFLSDSRRVTD